jgi:uncharacterized membrane protein YgcG
MKQSPIRQLWPFGGGTLRAIAVLCAMLAAILDTRALAQDQPQQQQGQASEPAAKTLPPPQLDSLLAPIALYPDPLLSQILVASTYPLEIVQADRWLQQNSSLKGTVLTEAAAKQSWGARNYNNRPNVAQTQQRLINPDQRSFGQANQNFGQNRGRDQGNLGAQRNFGGGGDRVGNHNGGGGSFGNNGRNAFGDMNQGGDRARQNAGRGASSFGGEGFRGGGRRR